jgi:phospholipid/cholesterol/gamma-HCH transport system substrate-binding protein
MSATARARRAAVIALLVVAGTAAAIVATSGDRAHTLRAVFDAAENVFPGQDVRVAGVRVGSISSEVRTDGQAVLGLRIDDGRIWPLHRGTTAAIRYGATASTFERYIELVPGPSGAPPLPDGGLLPRTDTVTPVEFDQIFNMLNAGTRHSLQQLITDGAAIFGPRAHALGQALAHAPGGLNAAANLMGALGTDTNALSVLVSSGARTTGALESENPRLQQLITTAASTFAELAQHSETITAALDRAPETMSVANTALAYTDQSLSNLDTLVADLRPGARGLLRLAPAAARAVAALEQVAPLASSTLREGANAAPEISRFLLAGTPFVGVLGRVMNHAAPELACVRPYTPELAGFLSTWAGFSQNYDASNHYARVLDQTPPFSDGTSLTSAQIVHDYPGQQYAYPRPPGLNAGQPWLQPACGAGASALNPSADPEATR